MGIYDHQHIYDRNAEENTTIIPETDIFQNDGIYEPIRYDEQGAYAVEQDACLIYIERDKHVCDEQVDKQDVIRISRDYFFVIDNHQSNTH